ncbi:dynein alpha chain, flagellar outer arm [Pycnococcus provasolii]|uniref:Dynein alpha chain, flagellar outer arm n=1 Tax=Pycnococcus provasolii TaxID=41880 RepID=A0A830H5N1_9CHLO|nr:dynein alpha chain, flagellar outer arm [Pycnococcus provasolii]
MKLIFEIRDLKFATPATATRAGILYISEERQWQNMTTAWATRYLPEYAKAAKWKDEKVPMDTVIALFDKYCPDTIFELKKSYQHLTPLATMNWVTSLVNILHGG